MMNVQSIIEDFESQVAFWADEAEASKDDYAYLALALSEADRIAGVKAQFEKVAEAFRENGMGLELANKDCEAWALVLPDASSPGKFRYQVFSADGFYAHVTRDAIEDVLLEAVNDGFTEPDEGALQRLAGTPQWRKGMLVTEIFMEVNSGQISHEQAEEKYEALQAAS